MPEGSWQLWSWLLPSSIYLGLLPTEKMWQTMMEEGQRREREGREGRERRKWSRFALQTLGEMCLW